MSTKPTDGFKPILPQFSEVPRDFLFDRPTTSSRYDELAARFDAHYSLRPISALYNTFGVPFEVLVRSKVLKSLLPSSMARTIPSILSKNARPMSFLRGMEFTHNPVSEQPLMNGWIPATLQFDGFLAFDGTSYSYLLDVNECNLPLLASVDAYQTALQQARASVYSISPRASGIGIAMPLQLGGIPNYAYAGAGPMPFADSMVFDLPSTLVNTVSLNGQVRVGNTDITNSVASSSYNRTFDNNLTTSATFSPSVLDVLNMSPFGPAGSGIGSKFTMSTFDAMDKDASAFAEFMRSFAVSPFFTLRGRNRGSDAIPPLAYTVGGARTFLAPANNNPRLVDNWNTFAGTMNSPSSGPGFITFWLNLNITTATYPKQTYPFASFTVAIDIDSAFEDVFLLVPQGVSVGNIFQPGMEVSAAQATPIRENPLESVAVAVECNFTAYGSAACRSWDLAFANPADLLIPSHLS